MTQQREKEVYFTVNDREEEMIKWLQNRIGIRSIDSLLMYLVNEKYNILKDDEQFKRDKLAKDAAQLNWFSSSKPPSPTGNNIPYQQTPPSY